MCCVKFHIPVNCDRNQGRNSMSHSSDHVINMCIYANEDKNCLLPPSGGAEVRLYLGLYRAHRETSSSPPCCVSWCHLELCFPQPSWAVSHTHILFTLFLPLSPRPHIRVFTPSNTQATHASLPLLSYIGIWIFQDVLWEVGQSKILKWWSKLVSHKNWEEFCLYISPHISGSKMLDRFKNESWESGRSLILEESNKAFEGAMVLIGARLMTPSPIHLH